MIKPKTNFFRLLLLALMAPAVAIAQQPSRTGHELVLRIDGLTSAERDAFKQALPADGSLELVYACVPAGILVIGSQGAATKTELRTQALPLATERLGTARVSEPAMDRLQAEAQCAAKRGQ